MNGHCNQDGTGCSTSLYYPTVTCVLLNSNNAELLIGPSWTGLESRTWFSALLYQH